MLISQMFKKQGSVAIKPTQLIFHSLGNGYSWIGGLGWLLDASNPLESHYAIRRDGYCVQLVDDLMRAEANYKANRRPDGTGAISVETDSDKAGDDPWSDEQVNAIVELAVEKCVEHDIPAVLCTGPDAPGIGWHIMWGSPGPWTPARKVCPGPKRIRQLQNVIMPRIQAGVLARRLQDLPTAPSTPPTPTPQVPKPAPTPTPEEDDMPFTPEQIKAFAQAGALAALQSDPGLAALRRAATEGTAGALRSEGVSGAAEFGADEKAGVVQAVTEALRSEGVSGAGDLGRWQAAIVPVLVEKLGELPGVPNDQIAGIVAQAVALANAQAAA